MPLLIDPGMSRRGWSYWGPWFQCPRLFAYQHRLGVKLIGSRPTMRGSMGHLLQAHQHAVWGARQPGGCWVGTAEGPVNVTDPAVLLPPEDALDAWLDIQVDRGAEVFEEDVGRMLDCFRAWRQRHSEPPGEVLWAEVEVTGAVGHADDEFGLWVVPTEVEELCAGATPEELCANQAIQTADGRTFTPTLVADAPVVITRRIDLVYRRGGKSAACDHKHTSVFEPGRAKDAYAMDGGMASQRVLCAQVFPDFRGLDLQIIHTQAPYKSVMVTPNPTPHRDAQFAYQLLRAAQAIAALDAEGLDPWFWPLTQSETSACYSRYGACKAAGLCSFGPAALEDL